jgi:hypothetical protein
MDAIAENTLKDEVELLTLARDFFKSLRCARGTDKVNLAILAGREEAAFQKRLDIAERKLGKSAKS